MEIIKSLQCRRLVGHPDAPSDKRYRYLAIQGLRHGRMRVHSAGRGRVLREPAVWLCYPGASYQLRPLEPDNERWFVGVWGPVVDRWRAEGLFRRPPQPVPLVALDARMELLRPLDQRTTVRDRRRATLLVEELLHWLAELRGDAAPSEDWPQTLYSELASRPEHEPDPAAIARRLGMGESTLRRRFRAAIGLPIHRAWLHGRIERACRLLLESDEPIAAIARRCGFDDPGYFSRCFRRATGQSPGSFRRDHGLRGTHHIVLGD